MATSSARSSRSSTSWSTDLDAADGRGVSGAHAREEARVAQVLKAEEERFGETLENGMKILGAALETLAKSGGKMLDGETAFTLYDTFGFPLDLTADVAAAAASTVDEAGFDDGDERAARSRARRVARSRWARSSTTAGPKTAFRGYETLSDEGRVVALYKDGAKVDALATGEAGHRRARPHAVLRRIGRAGRRPRRADEGRHVPHAVHGRRHAEDPARRVRPHRRGEDGRAARSATPWRRKSTTTRAAARCATTRPRT